MESSLEFLQERIWLHGKHIKSDVESMKVADAADLLSVETVCGYAYQEPLHADQLHTCVEFRLLW